MHDNGPEYGPQASPCWPLGPRSPSPEAPAFSQLSQGTSPLGLSLLHGRAVAWDSPPPTISERMSSLQISVQHAVPKRQCTPLSFQLTMPSSLPQASHHNSSLYHFTVFPCDTNLRGRHHTCVDHQHAQASHRDWHRGAVSKCLNCGQVRLLRSDL